MKNKKVMQITVKNHNGTIIYQGGCIQQALKEKRLYEYHTENQCTSEIDYV